MKNKNLIIFGIILIQDGIGQFFDFNPLPIVAMLVIFVMVVVYLAIMEKVKQLFYRKMTVKN